MYRMRVVSLNEFLGLKVATSLTKIKKNANRLFTSRACATALRSGNPEATWTFLTVCSLSDKTVKHIPRGEHNSVEIQSFPVSIRIDMPP